MKPINRRDFILTSLAGVLAFSFEEKKHIKYSDKEIRKILQNRIDERKLATGMAVGIVDGHKMRKIYYGKQDFGNSKAIDNKTIFEIGSVTKVFTALLLADMVYNKELLFDDPVALYLPPDFTVPKLNEKKITLADLATHTSGLPYFPFDVLTTPNPLDVLAKFTLNDLASWLSNYKLTHEPGSYYEYSNVGYGLLGLALATRAGTTYEDLLQKRILKPLKLNDTSMQTAGESVKRLAVGHNHKMEAVGPVKLGIFSPAGALRSTIDDLLKFLFAISSVSTSPLQKPSQLLLSIRRPAPVVGGEQAMGWDVVTGDKPFLAKDGVTLGHTATIAKDMSQNIGVVVLSNAFPINLGLPPGGGVGAADLARHLLRPDWKIG